MQFPGCLPGDGTPGIKLIEGLMARYKTVEKFDCSYWEGIVIGAIMAKAFERSHEKLGKIDSESINVALETFQNEDFGGLIPNVTYTDTDHGGSFTARIVKINEDQTFKPLTKFWNPAKDKVTIIK
jgi:hypothetical protein